MAPKIETSLAQGIWTWEKVAANALTSSTHRIWNAYACIWIMASSRAHMHSYAQQAGADIYIGLRLFV